MTGEEAIKVILDEWKCIDRNDGINCDRKCEKCDLVMDSAILKEAYNMAIKALEQEPIMRDVVGYEGIYTVDIFGNVFNADGKLMKQRTNEWGYFDIGLSKNNKQSRFKVHRLVAQAFIPNPQNKEQVNHIDGNKKNNAVWNLEWVTPKENTQHSIVTELRKTKIKDLTGKRFGNLVVKRYLGDTRKAGALRHLWECRQ